MKSLLFFLCLLFSFTKTTAQCYQLVWADEFSGSSLDLTKWTPIVGPGGAVSGNAELQYYTPLSNNNIQVSSGTLKIIAREESYGGNAYTSGRMETKNLGDWLYGKFEARIKLPVTQGMWPAFWMLPTDNTYGVWPRSGEMDIMELIGKEPKNDYSTIHTSDDGVDHGFGNHYTLPSGTFGDDFHVFSSEWSPNRIEFFMDGISVYVVTPSTVSPLSWVFNKRFYMLLNLAIGGPWAGAPDGTTNFPQQMEVDYVRVYQKIQDIAITGKTLVETNAPSVSYSVPTVAGMTYNWSVTNGTIASGQGTAQITVNWAGANGIVSATMNDGCTPSATVSTPVTVTPNLWDNYGFEQNYVSWDTRPAYSATATFSISTSDFTEGSKAACVTTNTAAPSTPWDIQLSRINLNLIAGTSYTLSFKAKANVNRTVPGTFLRPVVFSTVATKSYNLTTTWQTFTHTFMPSSNESVMWNVDLAGQLGTVCFDDFSFARTVLLPLELLDFQGFAEKDANRLTWSFADTKDLDFVEIEKSKNGLSFITTGSSYRMTKTSPKFNMVDETPFELTYYRLKIKELDGKISFSNTISIKRDESNFSKIKLYPNPVNDVLTIENADGQDVEIVNTLGIVVKTFQKAGTFGKLNVGDLPNGFYFLKIQNEVVRFVKN